MKYRRLGRSGLMISEIVLGTMNFGNPTDKAESFRIIDAALSAGINLFDCADVYAEGESEKILGEAFSRNGKRPEVFITSKVFMRTGEGPNDAGNSKHHILASCESSLRRLKTDYLDIYFLHRTDFDVPQEETLAALDLLVRQGKVRHIGCSTHPPWRVVEAHWIADKHHYPKFITEQPPYNLLDRRAETEIIPMCQAYDLGIICWSPLAQGVLAGRYRDATQIPPGSRGAFKKRVRRSHYPAGNRGGSKTCGNSFCQGMHPSPGRCSLGAASAGNHRNHYRAENTRPLQGPARGGECFTGCFGPGILRCPGASRFPRVRSFQLRRMEKGGMKRRIKLAARFWDH